MSDRPSAPVRGARAAVVALAVLTILAVGAAPAGAAAHVARISVQPGQSIQSAVDSARPGDTVVVAAGTYRESVLITTDDITLQGAGDGSGGTHLVPAADPSGPCGGQYFGICVVGRLAPDGMTVTSPVRNVRVTGVSVSGFAGPGPQGAGIFVLGASGTRIDHDRMVDNGLFGATSIQTSGDRYQDNTASNNALAGFQIAEAAGPGTIIEHNSAYGNWYGIFVVGSSAGGTAIRNEARDNCAGIVVAHVSGWLLTDNTADHNNRVCPGIPGSDPSASGNGITILGGRDVTVSDNTVVDNQPGAPSVISGGIVVRAPFAGPPPTGIAVVGNHLHGNQPADLIYDGTGSNDHFTANRCQTSIPSGLCGGSQAERAS